MGMYMAMQNVTMQVDKGILTIKINLGKDCGPSKTGKTRIVATSGGNVDVPGHPGVKLGINVYKPVQ